MKHSLLGALALTLAVAASGESRADRIDLTNKELGRIGAVEGGLEKLRVYLSRALIVERSSEPGEATAVDTGIESILEEKILEEIVTCKVRGKLIAVEGVETDSTSDPSRLDSLKLYVSFDPKCEETACAYVFSRPYLDDGRCSYGTCSYVRKFASDAYVLYDVPVNADYPRTSLYSRKILLKRRLRRDSHNVLSSGKNYRRAVRLQVDEDEIWKVIKESVKLPGWE